MASPRKATSDLAPVTQNALLERCKCMEFSGNSKKWKWFRRVSIRKQKEPWKNPSKRHVTPSESHIVWWVTATTISSYQLGRRSNHAERLSRSAVCRLHVITTWLATSPLGGRASMTAKIENSDSCNEVHSVWLTIWNQYRKFAIWNNMHFSLEMMKHPDGSMPTSTFKWKNIGTSGVQRLVTLTVTVDNYDPPRAHFPQNDKLPLPPWSSGEKFLLPVST